MNGSSIPRALDALVTTFTSAATSLNVIDGMAYDPTKVNFVCVGWDDGNTEAVTATRDIADGSMSQDMEVYDVRNLLSAWTGTKGTPSSARATAFDQFKVLGDALAADRTLGGAVTRARFTDYAMTQVNNGDGLLVNVTFVIHIESWK